MDGVDVTENMGKTWNNNYSISGFWKGWHASFNKWLVRYIYVPLGGTDNRNIAVWFVFGFVAIWHDAEAKLIAWGALNALFFVAEHLITHQWYAYIDSRNIDEEDFWPRQARALGGTTFVFIMMAVNSIGYSIGINGVTEGIMDIIFSSEGRWFLVGAYVLLFCAVHMMIVFETIEQNWDNLTSTCERRD